MKSVIALPGIRLDRLRASAKTTIGSSVVTRQMADRRFGRTARGESLDVFPGSMVRMAVIDKQFPVLGRLPEYSVKSFW